MITKYLTDSTREIYSELCDTGYKINLVIDFKYENPLKKANACFGVIPKNDKEFDIVTYSKEQNISAFTHELLHIYMFLYGFKNIDVILNDIQSFSRQFIMALNNIISHYKMIVIFENLGFDKNEFLNESVDELVQRATNEIQYIKKDEFEPFFSICFDMIGLSENFTNENLTRFICELEEKNSSFFKISSEMYSYWMQTEISDNLVFYKKLNELIINN